MSAFERDPRFPNRPEHPDFERLAEVVRKQDADAEAGGFEQALVGIIDGRSLVYMARQRAMRMALDDRLTIPLQTAWMDAFAAGVAYEAARRSE